MKTILKLVTVLFVSSALYCQSNITFDAGTDLIVQAGADICADGVIINGTWSGSGTKCGGALPVEMTSFVVTANKWNAELRWKTETEMNNAGFEIERRMTSPPYQGGEVRGGWQKIGLVQGAGTSNVPKEYSFTDGNLNSGKYVYRIKQIDNDGLYKYSESYEIEIGRAPRELMLAQNYPNPFNPRTEIEFTVPQDGQTTLTIYNSLGQLVATEFDGEAQAGYIQKAIFDASRFSSGIYFMRLQQNTKSVMKKIVLMK